MSRQYKIPGPDFELLVYLKPLKYFTKRDFLDGTLLLSWDEERFWRLVKQGWIEKTVKEKPGRKGYGAQYSLTLRAKMMIARLGKILDSRLPIPEGIKNKTMFKRTYSDKLLAMAIKKFNRKNQQ